jgi:hypothetical protein
MYTGAQIAALIDAAIAEYLLGHPVSGHLLVVFNHSSVNQILEGNLLGNLQDFPVASGHFTILNQGELPDGYALRMLAPVGTDEFNMTYANSNTFHNLLNTGNFGNGVNSDVIDFADALNTVDAFVFITDAVVPPVVAENYVLVTNNTGREAQILNAIDNSVLHLLADGAEFTLRPSLLPAGLTDFKFLMTDGLAFNLLNFTAGEAPHVDNVPDGANSTASYGGVSYGFAIGNSFVSFLVPPVAPLPAVEPYFMALSDFGDVNYQFTTGDGTFVTAGVVAPGTPLTFYTPVGIPVGATKIKFLAQSAGKQLLLIQTHLDNSQFQQVSVIDNSVDWTFLLSLGDGMLTTVITVN